MWQDVGQTLIPLYGHPRSIGYARRWTKTFLGDEHPLLPEIVQVVSELVTNAYLHSRSQDGFLIFGIRKGPLEVLVEVLDEGSLGGPVIRTPDDTDQHGRGLSMVAKMSSYWGSSSSTSAALVWAGFRVTEL